MAGTIRSLLRLNVVLPSNAFLRNTYINGTRFLYTEKSLGINGYESSRLNFRNQFMNVENAFREKMQEVCKEENSMIFTEDLKAMLHLVQKKDEDLELIMKMMEKFNSQNKELRFGTYIFGPVVMRALYYLDEPNLALSAFNNPQLQNFFDQQSSFQILLCLLYKHNMYTDMRNIYNIIKAKHLDGNTHPRNAVILIMASCFKENTPATLEYALELWKELVEKGYRFTRRAITFLTALALKQDKPHIAFEVLTAVREPRYVDTRCLKVMTYIQMNRFTDIVPIFRMTLENERPNARKETYFYDVIEKLEESLANANIDKDAEIYKLISALKEYGHITHTETLESHICAPIDIPNRPFGRKLNLSQQEMFNKDKYFRRSNDRPGLRDLL